MNLLIVTQKVDENDQLLGFFIEWLKRFAEKFEKITVICLEKGEFSLPENAVVFSLGKEKLENLKFKNLLKILERVLYGLCFCKYIWQLRKEYDAVFVHMNPIWVVLGGLPWRILNKKIFFWYTSGGITTKLKLAEKLADVIFTASKESFRLLSKKVIITGHGIDTGLFQPSLKFNVNPSAGGETLKILSVGRIAPVKNYEILIEAAKILKEKGIDFCITIIGEAPLESDKKYEKSLKFKVKSLKLEEKFDFVGKVNHKDLPAIYQLHDIFVHLSKTGSLDKTVLEAMACGIKVLSSNDASKSFLPENLIFNDKSSEELVNKIATLKNLEPSSSLREYVVQNHNLDDLISKITKTVNER